MVEEGQGVMGVDRVGVDRASVQAGELKGVGGVKVGVWFSLPVIICLSGIHLSPNSSHIIGSSVTKFDIQVCWTCLTVSHKVDCPSCSHCLPATVWHFR